MIFDQKYPNGSESEPSDDMDPRSSIEDVEEQSFFEQDVSLFRDIGGNLLEDMLRTGEDAKEYPMLMSVDSSPFIDSTILRVIMQGRGLRMGFSEYTTDNSPGKLAVRVHPEDVSLHNSVLVAFLNGSHKFIHRVTNSLMFSTSIDYQQGKPYEKFRRQTEQAFSNEGEESPSSDDIDNLAKRGFLTSHLLKNIEWSERENKPDENLSWVLEQMAKDALVIEMKLEEATWYETLRAQDYRPFGTEELFGMVNKIFMDILDQNPEIAEEFRRRREEKARGNDLG